MASPKFRYLTRLVLVFGVCLSLLSYAVSVGVALWAYFLSPVGMSEGPKHLYGLPIYYFLFFHTVFPFQMRVDAAFGILVAIYAVVFAGAFIVGRRFDESVKDALKGDFHSSFRNWLFTMPVLIGVMLSVLVIVAFIQSSAGIETGSMDFSDLYRTFFYVSLAPIIEEVGFRIVPLGTFLFLSALVLYRDKFAQMNRMAVLRTLVFAFLFPPKMKETLGLPAGRRTILGLSITRAELFLIVLTSLLFGLAHFFYGWEVGKISLTAIGGLVLGTVFLLYGAPAAILTHWFVNFGLPTYLLFLPKIRVVRDLVLMPGIAILITGIAGWVFLLGKAVSRLRRFRQERSRK